jgi:hypothetical protein
MHAVHQALTAVREAEIVRRRRVAGLAACATLAVALAGPSPADAQIPPKLNLCQIAPADATLTLGDSGYATVAVSGLSVKPGAMCTRLMVDVATGTNGKLTLRSRYAGPVTGPVDPSDDRPPLPLSKPFCNSYRQYVTVYRSYFGKPFLAMASATLKGSWAVYIDSPGPSHCVLVPDTGDPLSELESFTSPWNVPATYRVAVSAYVGTAAQPVTVTAAHS